MELIALLDVPGAAAKMANDGAAGLLHAPHRRRVSVEGLERLADLVVPAERLSRPPMAE